MNIVEEVNALRAQGKTVRAACRKLGVKTQAYYNRSRAGKPIESAAKPAPRPSVRPVVKRVDKPEMAALWKGEIVYVMNRKTAVQLIRDLGI